VTYRQPTRRRSGIATRRRRAAMALALLVSAALAWLPMAPAEAATTSAPSYTARLLTLINQTRVAHGLQPLALYDPLSSQAYSWAYSMASRNTLSHDSSFFAESARVCSVSMARENVAMSSTSADSMFRMYMNSSGHRANILSADTQFIGIATVSEPWSSDPSQLLYWNTTRFVGGRCPGSVSSSTPTTMTLTSLATPANPDVAFTLKAALVAPSGPSSRSARIEFVPTATGVASTWWTVTLTNSTAHPTIYNATMGVRQNQTGVWRISYSGQKISATVGDTGSSRTAFVAVRTHVGGYNATKTWVSRGATLSDYVQADPGWGRTAYHQYRTCSTCSWVTYKTYTMATDGSTTLTWRVATGTRYWRLYFPNANIGLGAITATRTITGT